MFGKAGIISAVLAGIAWAQDKPAQTPLETATKLNNQALAFSKQGKLKDAEELYRSALAIQCDELARATIATNLAFFYKAQDRYFDAERVLRQALKWRQKGLPAGSVEIAYSFSNLADIYATEGRDWEARNLFEEAVRIFRDFHPDDAAYSVMRSNLAVVLCKFKDYDRAEKLLRQALKDSERDHGPMSHDVGIALNNLAQVLRAKKNFKQAAEMYARAVQILESLGPEARTDLAIVLANQGQLLDQQQECAEARQAERRALDLLGPEGNAPIRTVILQNLGNITADDGNPTAALPYFEKALDLQEKVLGAEHPAMVRLLLDYAAATLRAGQKALAKKLRKRAQDIVARLQISAPDRLTVSVDSLRENR